MCGEIPPFRIPLHCVHRVVCILLHMLPLVTCSFILVFLKIRQRKHVYNNVHTRHSARDKTWDFRKSLICSNMRRHRLGCPDNILVPSQSIHGTVVAVYSTKMKRRKHKLSAPSMRLPHRNRRCLITAYIKNKIKPNTSKVQYTHN